MSDDLREFLANARGNVAAARRVDGVHGGQSLGGRSPLRSLDELRARHGAPEVALAEQWGLAALRGRLVELSARGATATLTAAIDLVLEAQTLSEPVAWLVLGNGTFYPPDVADSGVDLAALVVIRATDTTGAARAAERVLRSGAFGLVVLDLGGHVPGARDTNDISMVHQGRLVTLAQAHDAAVVCITDKTEDTPSLGSLVSLRAEALRVRASGSRGDFELTVRALKDKRRGPGWTRKLAVRGPAGC
ncbi:MAG: recombinase A [Myxococcota bacterium]|nr:recombinase A [Myxococcota bacterium]